MKIASLLAGVAAVALTAAPAFAEGSIYRGAATGTFQVTPNITVPGNPGIVIPPLFPGLPPIVIVPPSPPTVIPGQVFTGTTTDTGLVAIADALNPDVNSQIALFTIKSSGFAGDSGDLNQEAGASFSLSGNVNIDCAYYTGGTNTEIDFGTIGINAQGNNPDAAFEMIGGDRTVSIDSNLAGCNTKNTVTFAKTDLSNTTNNGGYDAVQFTNVIPVTMVAKFVAGVEGATTAGQKVVTLDQAGNQASGSTYGAWKSYMDIDLTLENPMKGLLAGEYAGTVSVEIKAAAL